MSWSVEETIDVVMRDQMPLLQQELASSAAEFFAVVRERRCSSEVEMKEKVQTHILF